MDIELSNMADRRIIEVFKQGGVVVMPTDTIYGVLGQALKPKTVARIRRLKSRSDYKPFIILIDHFSELEQFGIKLNQKETNMVKRFWPGPVSIILPLPTEAQERLAYLHVGTNTLAFRLPRQPDLIKILRQTGPLVAPSANPEGKPPASTVQTAKDYFGGRVDCYIDGGLIERLSSKLVALREGEIITFRA